MYPRANIATVKDTTPNTHTVMKAFTAISPITTLPTVLAISLIKMGNPLHYPAILLVVDSVQRFSLMFHCLE